MNATHDGTDLEARSGRFTTTQWSLVLDARGDSHQAQRALGKLCQIYWFPLYCYVRRSGYGREDAEDLTQEFFRRLIEKGYVDCADADKGRFRSYLLVLLKRFMINEWHRSKRQKRGNGCPIISLDADAEAFVAEDIADGISAEKVFERRWAMSVLDRALKRLEAEYKAAGNAELFDVLRVFLTGDRGERPYLEVAAELQMNENTVKSTVRRLRQRFRDQLRMEIAETVARPEEIEAEMRHLLEALS